jgi:hypothetical protein
MSWCVLHVRLVQQQMSLAGFGGRFFDGVLAGKGFVPTRVVAGSGKLIACGAASQPNGRFAQPRAWTGPRRGGDWISYILFDRQMARGGAGAVNVATCVLPALRAQQPVIPRSA